jgi:uncharacterized protein (DUF488 family)
MNAEESPVIVYTIGHGNSGHDLPNAAPEARAQKFIDLLSHHAVTALVDVRSAPYSQFNPQFNRETLARTLSLAGIAYRYEGKVLGGRPDDLTCSTTGSKRAGADNRLRGVDYLAVAQRPWYRAGIQRLIDIAIGQPCALMCSEENPQRCHRHHLITQTLLEASVIVRHLRHNGAVEIAPFETRQLNLF